MDGSGKRSGAVAGCPFDSSRLDRLMDEAGLDVVVATSKHCVQYLLGGHRAFFFDVMDAMGLSRYLPVFVYPKGAPEKAAFFGHRGEAPQHEITPFWVGHVMATSTGSVDVMEKAAAYIADGSFKARRIGVEMAFLPADSHHALVRGAKGAQIADAWVVLERLRAIKTAAELAKLKIASERVIDAMLAVIANHGPGVTKRDLNEALRREETNRGLVYEYCLMTAGTSLNRVPTSEQVWGNGDILSLDSGGNYHGYIGDICRMAIQGEPDAELEDLLAEIETIQRACMKPIKAGALGNVVYGAAEALVEKSAHRKYMDFLAHGMGLISHEAPRLTSKGPAPYDAYDADRPLEAGMVLSVETTMKHPRRGFIKLEDTAVVTATGFEIYGEGGLGWNRAGTAVAR